MKTFNIIRIENIKFSKPDHLLAIIQTAFNSNYTSIIEQISASSYNDGIVKYGKDHYGETFAIQEDGSSIILFGNIWIPKQ